VISDGEDARALIERLHLESSVLCPDVLLLDVLFPKCDGFQVLNRLRASPHCGQTPVVVLGSPPLRQNQHHPREDVSTRFFPKPTSFDKFVRLGAVIKEVIGTRPVSISGGA
jgi:two-component system, chemotaxis family, response regulator Rcp1